MLNKSNKKQMKNLNYNLFTKLVSFNLGYDLNSDQMIWAYNIYSMNPKNGVYPAVKQVLNKINTI